MIENLTVTIISRGYLTGSISSKQRLQASLTSLGQLTGNITGKGSLEASISSLGQLFACITGSGRLEASIIPRGRLIGSIAGLKLGEEEYESYMLVYEDGTELPAVFVENEVVFTATENDIRKDTIAATAKGVTVGTKEIPAYHTSEGYKLVPNGTKFILGMKDYDYTKLQAIFCPFNTNLSNSVEAEKVAIENTVYSVNSVIPESTIVLDHEGKNIDFGITNDSGILYLIRYFSYKEIY